MSKTFGKGAFDFQDAKVKAIKAAANLKPILEKIPKEGSLKEKSIGVLREGLKPQLNQVSATAAQELKKRGIDMKHSYAALLNHGEALRG
ncbi:MAG: hypothetical protein LBQ15_05040 [Clostridium sp.]|nr:hypothetical protein [Clostridium sp.]